MNKKLIKTLCLGLSALVLVGCSGQGGHTNTETGNGTESVLPESTIVPNEGHLYSEYFAGKEFKKTYNAFASEAIKKSLNYLKYNDGALAKHWANFVDGLLLQNEYHVLEKLIATRASQDNQTIFTFDVKAGVPWVTYQGRQYEAIINGDKVPQYVSAQDFVTSAEAVLNYSNESQLTYLYGNFIKGAVEYNKFTYIKHQIQNGSPAVWGKYKDIKKFTKLLNELIEKETGEKSNVLATEDMLKSINNFERVGVKVVKDPKTNGGGTIQYELNDKAFYFPTLLAYSCYLPVNAYFLKDVTFKAFGAEKDKLLYCGPFTLAESTGEKIVYKKNPLYHRADRVLIDTINYRVYGEADNPDTARKEFEQGNIDAFGLTTRDREGWDKYIVGPDKKNPGTLEKPYSSLVNSREYDYIDYVYGLQINVNRTASSKGNVSQQSYAKGQVENADGNLTQIKNAEKALRIEEVRRFVMESFDIPEHNKRYAADGSRPGQYMINTFVPKGFVQDENSQDYTTTHYYKAYADWYEKENGVRLELTSDDPKAVTVDSLIKQGQYSGTYIGKKSDINALRDEAIAAIEAYNKSENALPENGGPITFPVQMEMFSNWNDKVMRGFDVPLLRQMNRRLNNMYKEVEFTRANTGLSADKTTGGFLVIPTYEVKAETNQDVVTNGGNWDIGAIWGWGPDYGDPMSYMNTYAIHGDWSNILGFVADEYTPNFHVENGKVVETNLLGEYTELVKAADDTVDVIADRYAKFAHAECMLINELNLFKPLTMTGQGRQASVSRAAGYHNPQGSYGLAKDRNDGLIVLKSPITGEERVVAKARYDGLKEDYLARHGSINIY